MARSGRGGENGYGQLGIDSTTDQTTPQPVSTLSNVVQVAGSGTHAIARTADGKAWTWGYNNTGQIGDNTTTQRNAPVQVSGITNVIRVAAGYSSSAGFSAVLKADGTVWSWGANGYGQLVLPPTSFCGFPTDLKVLRRGR